ncbi:SAM-dependent methyltransferase [Roseivirga pacifica]|uniref:SAM-dependent methyltransferase n=1 Tax=Roseivirga pacifica TaxID=1267423 RepID=UPI003BAFDBDF
MYREPFVRTPQELVDTKLELAEITAADTVVDLGCGDAFMLIEACQRYGCKAIGLELDAEVMALAKANVAKHNLQEQIELLEEDYYQFDYSRGTVYLIYLSRWELGRLSLPMEEAVKQGTRVVTHDFDMPAWKEAKHVAVPLMAGDTKDVYLYKVT